MKKLLLLLFVVVLAGCGPSESATTETVESLAADPIRLKELRQQCKLDRAKLGDALCSRVAEATRKRFYGESKVPYTPSENPPKL